MAAASAYIEQHKEKFEKELFELLRIPSVSTDPERKEEVHQAVSWLHNHLSKIGLNRVETFDTEGFPVVYAQSTQREGLPVVLIYGHYDVQPPEPLEEWSSPPFDPVVRNGRIYARGASDDKGQSFAHLKSIEALLSEGKELPVNVKILLEGEEEIGSPNLPPFLKEHRKMLSCDMVLISDTSMFAENRPSITYGLRGLAYMEVLVQGPNRDLHSGVYGGTVRNPANALCEMISGLTDPNGKVLIPGFYEDVVPLDENEREAFSNLPFDEEAYKKSLGLDALYGEQGYSTLERASARPTLDVNGLWSGYQGEGAKTVLPARAGAKVSMRLVPNQKPGKIARLFTRYIRSVSPDGLKVTIKTHHGGDPAMTPLDFYGLKAAGKAFSDIYNTEVLFTREGGSIPVVADFTRILDAPSILMGFGLKEDALHSPDESFSLTDFHRGIRTSARFLEILPEFAELRL
ncbi:MAG: dipeptidase [Balneolaceae bacterium]